MPLRVDQPLPYERTQKEDLRILDYPKFSQDYSDTSDSPCASRSPVNVIDREDITPAQLCVYGVRKDPNPEECTWIQFFERMSDRTAKSIAVEDEKTRQTRLNRERVPPITSKATSFFVWDKNEKGVFRRRRANEDDLESLFTPNGKFCRSQGRYNAAFNEWDLCEYFGVPDLETVKNIAKSQAKIGLINYDLSLTLLKIKYGYLPLPSHAPSRTLRRAEQQSLPSPVTQLPPAPLERIEMEIDKSAVSSSEEGAPEAEYKAYLLYGYTRSIEGELDPGPAVSAAYVPKALGMHHLDKAIWERRDSGQPLVKFLLALGKRKPPQDFWDLSKTNRMPVTTLRRFQNLRHSRVSTLVRVVDWNNLEGRTVREERQSLPVFWFDIEPSEGWKVGCHSAAHALMMCRMPQSHTPISLAYALVTACIRFHTWVEVHPQGIDTVLNPETDRFIKFRHRLSEFGEKDYQSYLNDRAALLDGPRGRAALMRGGIISKLAQETVSIHDVFVGPSSKALSGRGILRHNGLGGYLLDDSLSTEEEEAVCGHYDVYG